MKVNNITQIFICSLSVNICSDVLSQESIQQVVISFFQRNFKKFFGKVMRLHHTN